VRRFAGDTSGVVSTRPAALVTLLLSVGGAGVSARVGQDVAEGLPELVRLRAAAER